MMVVERTIKQRTVGHPSITSFKENARGVSQPHDDTLVVTLVISNYITHRILIDNGSSTNIFYLSSFDQMNIG